MAHNTINMLLQQLFFLSLRHFSVVQDGLILVNFLLRLYICNRKSSLFHKGKYFGGTFSELQCSVKLRVMQFLFFQWGSCAVNTFVLQLSRSRGEIWLQFMRSSLFRVTIRKLCSNSIQVSVYNLLLCTSLRVSILKFLLSQYTCIGDCIKQDT